MVSGQVGSGKIENNFSNWTSIWSTRVSRFPEFIRFVFFGQQPTFCRHKISTNGSRVTSLMLSSIDPAKEMLVCDSIYFYFIFLFCVGFWFLDLEEWLEKIKYYFWLNASVKLLWICLSRLFFILFRIPINKIFLCLVRFFKMSAKMTTYLFIFFSFLLSVKLKNWN